MTNRQFKKANNLVLTTFTAMLFLILLLMLAGCVTEKEVVYKKVYFADTNGVTTTIYYPNSFKKDMRINADKLNREIRVPIYY
jgi:uncharacterized lipoprotein YehR (DUF1307 family)